MLLIHVFKCLRQCPSECSYTKKNSKHLSCTHKKQMDRMSTANDYSLEEHPFYVRHLFKVFENKTGLALQLNVYALLGVPASENHISGNRYCLRKRSENDTLNLNDISTYKEKHVMTSTNSSEDWSVSRTSTIPSSLEMVQICTVITESTLKSNGIVSCPENLYRWQSRTTDLYGDVIAVGSHLWCSGCSEVFRRAA